MGSRRAADVKRPGDCADDHQRSGNVEHYLGFLPPRTITRRRNESAISASGGWLVAARFPEAGLYARLMPASSTSLVTVIVSYNTADLLTRCLESLLPQMDADDTLVVVDNASRDGSADMVERDFPQVLLVRSAHNLGFGRACNIGASKGSGSVLLFNPDAIAYDGMIANLKSAPARLPGARIIGGRSVDERGDTDPRSCWGAPTVWSTLCFAMGLSSVFKRSALFNPEAMPSWDRMTEREVDMVSGALMLVERQLWNELSGFDERYFMYGEDLDLCLRASELGAKPTLIPTVVFRHDVGAASTGVDKRRMLLTGKITAVLRNNRRARGAAMRTLMVAGCAMRALVGRLIGRETSWRLAWSVRSEWQYGYPA
jgi:N-acetylglucosaminyl-diphospho-decaprenol L-rhamnosyltransferase